MSSPRSCARTAIASVFVASSASSPTTAFKKKLYALDPKRARQEVLTQRTRKRVRVVSAEPRDLERDVRQLLADKVSGNQVGIWLLVPEHLRLGTWDLLCGWSGQPGASVAPRMAMHLVNEAAMCLCSLRNERTLSQKGFELANGLAFVPTDTAIHELLEPHSVAEAQTLQVGLGKLRRQAGHFPGRVLALDPHRMISQSKRQMRRHRFGIDQKPVKMAQGFFLLDCESTQPVCFTLASAAASAVEMTSSTLDLAAEILGPGRPSEPKPLVLADKEHYSLELMVAARQAGNFDLLCAVPAFDRCVRRWQSVPQASFTEQWPGYATATSEFRFEHAPDIPFFEFVQRTGTKPANFHYQGFLCTAPLDELYSLAQGYPQRWTIESFFKSHQALGWKRAGTPNLNIRYAQMSFALLAQAACDGLRKRLGPPFHDWDALHLARNLFHCLDGDIRVHSDTIVVTFYNAPNAPLLRSRFEGLPAKLIASGICPTIPWLYDFKLDFRFR